MHGQTDTEEIHKDILKDWGMKFDINRGSAAPSSSPMTQDAETFQYGGTAVYPAASPQARAVIADDALYVRLNPMMTKLRGLDCTEPDELREMRFVTCPVSRLSSSKLTFVRVDRCETERFIGSRMTRRNLQQLPDRLAGKR